MTIPANNLFLSLLEKRTGINTETDLHVFTKAAKQAHIGFMNVCEFFEDLPPEETQPIGSLWLVENDNTVYFVNSDNEYEVLA